MSKFTLTSCLLYIFVFLTACSNDDSSDFNAISVIGTWELTTWTIQTPINLNNDAIFSTNLLDEAPCDNNEILIFDVDGTVSSNMTYNPQVTISLLSNALDDYVFIVSCDMQGSIGTAGSYTQNNNLVNLFNTTAVIDGNQLTLIYEDAIDIYNEDFTEISFSKDLTLVYTKI
jgi:hypothetical protein